MMRRLVPVLLILLYLVTFATAATPERGERLINSSEPWFLRNIGPENPRVDNPWAAGITAVAVAAVILRGLQKYRESS